MEKPASLERAVFRVFAVVEVGLTCSAVKNCTIRKEGYSSHFLAHGCNFVFEDVTETAPAKAPECTPEAEARVALRHEACSAVS